MTQKSIIIGSILFINFAIFARLFDLFEFLPSRTEMKLNESFEMVALFLLPVVLVTSITLNSVTAFAHWWRFAKYALPICLILVVLISLGVLHTSTYGTFGWGGILNQMYDFWGLAIVYAFFIIGSFIQIIRGYRAGRSSRTL
jgi:hypothetical protein